MSLNRASNGKSTATPLFVSQTFNDTDELYYNALGLDPRLRQDNYPAIIRIGSVHTELEINSPNNLGASNYDNRISIGMPRGSADKRFVKPSSSGTFYLASTSANDTSAGTGARTIFIRGLLETSTGVYEEGSETVTLNGQTSVATSLSTWFRVNLLFMLSSGSTNQNQGEIYCADTDTFTAGIPAATTTVSAIVGPNATFNDGFGLSTQGDVSVGTFQTFVFVLGNIFTDERNTTAKIVERYSQPFNSDTFQVGFYSAGGRSYDYRGAGSYTAKTDVMLDVFDTASAANRLQIFTYYIEFCLIDNRLINATPIGFSQL